MVRLIGMTRKLPYHNSEKDKHKKDSEEGSIDVQVPGRPESIVALDVVGATGIFSTNAVVGREFGSTVPSLMGVLGDCDDVWGEVIDGYEYAHAHLDL